MAVDRKPRRGPEHGADRGHRPRKRRRRQTPRKTPRAPAAPARPSVNPGPVGPARDAATGPDAAELARRFLDRARATWTVVAPYLSLALSFAHRGLTWLAHALWRHRLTVFRATHRLMWWGALAAMFVAGRALLSGTEIGPIVDEAHLWFGGGLALCLVVLLFAAERRMRLAAFVLGAGHGAFGLVSWLITQA